MILAAFTAIGALIVLCILFVFLLVLVANHTHRDKEDEYERARLEGTQKVTRSEGLYRPEEHHHKRYYPGDQLIYYSELKRKGLWPKRREDEVS